MYTNSKITSAALLIALTSTTQALANGFVKRSGEYYSKFSLSQTASEKTDGSNDFNVNENNAGLYAEYGLATPFASQAIFSTNHKTYSASDKDSQGEFEVSDFTGFDIAAKIGLPSIQAGYVSIFSAVDLGVGFPLAREETVVYTGQPDLVEQGEVAKEDQFLVGALDRGTTSRVYGLGISILPTFGGAWLNLAYQKEEDTGNRWSNDKLNTDIGIGLPGASWLQISATRSTSSDEQLDNDGNEKTSKVTEESTAVSLGYTFFKGYALEVGYKKTSDNTKKTLASNSIEIGISTRSL